jgi:pimeloyl-ACP methyl ester carboxylesterase
MHTFDVTTVNMEVPLTNSATNLPRNPRQPPLAERLAFLAIQNSFRFGSVLAPKLTAKRALHYFMTPTRIPAPGWETELKKTARRIELKSGLIAYAWGSGPRVLVVHGWDGRGTQMGRIATAVAAAGFEAVVVDLPGHGESPGNLAHVPLAKDALLTVGDELGPFHTVMGHSFGAGAVLFAVFQGLAAGRVVYLAGPSRFTTIFDRYCEWVKVWGHARVLFDEMVMELVDIDPTMNYPSLWVRKVDQPALIVHDLNDEDCPFEESEEMHREWRGSELFATKGLGHRRILKSKEVIAKIVDFLGTP